MYVALLPGLAALVLTGAPATQAPAAPAAQIARPAATAGTPLKSAIMEFNQRSAEDRIGKDQPALTEAEVKAAILWASHQRDRYPVDNAEFAAFTAIAETGVLPPGAEFEVLRGYQPNDQEVFTVWSVRIRMPRGGPRSGSYAYILRERIISRRPIGDEERRVMRKWDRPMGSFERPKYFKELEEARRKDEAKKP
jgi:hypothetical protein